MSKKGTKIGELIKRARLRKKLSAEAVAEACNVSRSRVYQWEAGDYVMPKNFAGLEQALGLSQRTLKSVNGDRAAA